MEGGPGNQTCIGATVTVSYRHGVKRPPLKLEVPGSNPRGWFNSIWESRPLSLVGNGAGAVTHPIDREGSVFPRGTGHFLVKKGVHIASFRCLSDETLSCFCLLPTSASGIIEFRTVSVGPPETRRQGR